MMKSLLLAVATALVLVGPAGAVDLEYLCSFTQTLPTGRIFGGFHVGPDGKVRRGEAGWKFKTGAGFDDIELEARLGWRGVGMWPTYTSFMQELKPPPTEEARIAIRPSAGGATEVSFIEPYSVEEWRREGFDSYGRGDLIPGLVFNKAFWTSDRIDVEIVALSGAVLLKKSHALPAREARAAIDAQLAIIEAAVTQRDFSRCKQYDLDQEADPSEVSELLAIPVGRPSRLTAFFWAR